MDDRRAALVRAARTAAESVYGNQFFDVEIEAAISLALEEAAVACENIYGEEGCACNDWPTPEQCAAAIRALKGGA